MIKELFATCLLSASVGTSGLNMQTRDNQTQVFNYTLYPSDETAWNSTYDTADTTSQYYEVGIYSRSQYATAITPLNSNLLRYGYLACNDNKQFYSLTNTYNTDIYCFTITSNQVITKATLHFGADLNIANNGNVNNAEIRVFSTTDTRIYNDYSSINWEDMRDQENAEEMWLRKLQSGQIGYKYTNYYKSTDQTQKSYQENINIDLLYGQDNYLFITATYKVDDNYNLKDQTYANPLLFEQLYINGQYAINPTTQEIINIPGLMFTVLTMPFTFISQAFDVTLFPGTPYQVNISALIIAIVSTMILAWLLGLIIKGLK